MKHSIKKLPIRSQEEIDAIVDLLKRNVPKCEKIILFGSYARGTYVLWDEKVEFGVKTSYRSDYDILVVTSQKNTYTIENNMWDKVNLPYEGLFAYRRHASPNIIIENIASLNDKLSKKQYFFSEVIQTGILLYDNGNVKLSNPRKQSYNEILTTAQEDYREYFEMGSEFLYNAGNGATREKYKMAAYLCHQCCEKLLNAVSLVFINYKPKEHRINELIEQCRDFFPEAVKIFACETKEDKKAFDLLCRAYIEGRYNKEYEVTNIDLLRMIDWCVELKESVEVVCDKRLLYYEERIEEEQQKSKKVVKAKINK